MRVLIIRDRHHWVAQCADHDIAAYSLTRDGAQTAFERTVHAERHRCSMLGNGIEAIAPPPGFIREMWDDAVTHGPAKTLTVALEFKRDPVSGDTYWMNPFEEGDRNE